MARTLSDKGVAALKPRPKTYTKPDPELRGHWIRVQPSGAKSFVTVTRTPEGKQVWTTVGRTDAMGIEAARARARLILTRVRAGLPAVEPKGETLGLVIDRWLQRHVAAKGLRSRAKIVDLLDRHVSAEFRAREFTTIRRSDVVALLDEIEDDHSPRQADAVLTIIRSIMNWYATRHDDYVPPLVRGMGRVDPEKKGRDRVLSDEELRAVWLAAEANGTFGALVRVLVLTGQRLDKVITMKWTDISPMKWPANEPPTWTIPWEPREKENAGMLQLPAAALAILDKLPRYADNPFVFASSQKDGKPISKSGKYKNLFDAKLPAMPRWTLHDLRRTARSLMSRAGVSSEHAERVMGHAIGGVEGVYDRHAYVDEKAAALVKLAGLIDSIVHPRVGKKSKAENVALTVC
jgi:integrase